MSSLTTHSTFPWISFHRVHFSHNASTIWATFFHSSHCLIVAENFPFVWDPIWRVLNYFEPDIVDIEYTIIVVNLMHISLVVMIKTGTSSYNMWTRHMESLKFPTITPLCMQVDLESSIWPSLLVVDIFADSKSMHFSIKLIDFVSVGLKNNLHCKIIIKRIIIIR